MFIINFAEIYSNTEFQSGSPKSVSFLGKRRKEWSVYYKFRRNLFKHGISFDVVGATIGRPFYFSFSVIFCYNMQKKIKIL